MVRKGNKDGCGGQEGGSGKLQFIAANNDEETKAYIGINHQFHSQEADSKREGKSRQPDLV